MDVGTDFTPLLSNRELHAPQLLDYFTEFRLECHGIELLRHRIWALRHDFSPYDASYVALAEALGIPLVTSDLRLANAARQYCDVLTP